MAYQVACDVAYQVAQSNGPVVAQSWTSRGDKSAFGSKRPDSTHGWSRGWSRKCQMLVQKGKHK